MSKDESALSFVSSDAEQMLVGGRDILLVENDEIDVMTVQRALKLLNIDNPLRVAQHGEAAIDELRRSSRFPGLILVDLNMPVMSGLELLSALKRDSGLRRIPVVVLTTSAMPRDRQRCYDLGAAGYLVKPSRFPELVQVLRALTAYWSISLGP